MLGKIQTLICLILTGFGVFFWTGDGSAATTLRQTVSTSLSYDNNASIVADDENGVSDFYMTIEPGISLSQEHRTYRLNADYTFSALFYLDNSSLNTFNHAASAGLSMDLSRSNSFSLTETFGYTRDSRDTTTTGIQISRARIYSNSLTAGLTHMLGQRTSIGLTLEDRLLILKGANASDSRTDSASLNGGFQLTDSTSLNTSYTFTNFYFNAAGVKNTFTSHSVQVGASQLITPSLRFSLSGGAVYTPSISEHYDWILTSNLSKVFEKTSVSLGYTRSLLNASGLTTQLNISERFLGNLAHSFTSATSLAIFGNYSLNHTKPVATVDMRSYEVGVSLHWVIKSWLTATLGGSHFEQEALGTLGSDMRRDNLYISFNITTFEKKFD